MNISANCKPRATIRNNYISGVFYENKHVGVFFRNKATDGIVRDNEVHAIVYDNESKSALGSGLSTDANPSIGAYVDNLTGTVVAFDNENEEVDLSTAKDSKVILYHPRGTTVSADVGDSSYDNDVSIKEFTCSQPPDAEVCQEYCAQ